MQYNRLVKAPTSVLRHMYKQLVHDPSASASALQQVIDDRVAEAILDSQDPEIILDLFKRRSHHSKSSGKRYKIHGRNCHTRD